VCKKHTFVKSAQVIAGPAEARAVGLVLLNCVYMLLDNIFVSFFKRLNNNFFIYSIAKNVPTNKITYKSCGLRFTCLIKQSIRLTK